MDPISLRERAKECRRLAQEADLLDSIRKHLRRADELDREAERHENPTALGKD